MPWRNTEWSFGIVAKFLHWAIVILIVGQFVLAKIADGLPRGAGKLELMGWHKSFGIVVLILAVFRVGWKLVNPTPQPLGMRPSLQRLSAAITHGLLYLLIILQPISGWLTSSSGNSTVSFFGWFQLPNLVSPSEDLHHTFEEVHEFLAGALLAVAALHVFAALYHHFWLKDDVLRRMLPFGGSRAQW